jgi:hypothetical protein
MGKSANSKRAQYFEKVKKYKERFAELTSAELQTRLAVGPLFKEASVAIREILKERGERNPQ